MGHMAHVQKRCFWLTLLNNTQCPVISQNNMLTTNKWLNNRQGLDRRENVPSRLLRERIPEQGEAAAPDHPLEVSTEVVRNQLPKRLPTNQKLSALLLGVVSMAMIVIVAW